VALIVTFNQERFRFMGCFKDEERGRAVYGTAARCKTVEIKVIDRRKPEPLPHEDLCKNDIDTAHHYRYVRPSNGLYRVFPIFHATMIVGSFC
jgi:hypothetical protein